jgi:ABC-type transport system involved in multi-copper enzyme maturation permease subunit
MKNLDVGRVSAVVRKELRDYRRKRSIIVTMAVLPAIFLIEPVLAIFVAPAFGTPSALASYVVVPMLYMLLIPVIIPATLAAYSIAGEREQGTLEPLLTTPIRQQEFILGKATAVMIPSVFLSYAVFALFLLATRLFANSAVSSAVFHRGPILLAVVLFAPLSWRDGRLWSGWRSRYGRARYASRNNSAPSGASRRLVSSCCSRLASSIRPSPWRSSSRPDCSCVIC